MKDQDTTQLLSDRRNGRISASSQEECDLKDEIVSNVSGDSEPWGAGAGTIAGSQACDASWTTAALTRRVEELSAEVNRLKRRTKDRGQNGHSQKPRVKIVSRWQTLYRIHGGIHLREPFWIDAQNGCFELKGDTRISNINNYLRRHDDVVFVAFRDYDGYVELSATTQLAEDDSLPQPQPLSESVMLTSPQMISVMKKFLSVIPGFKESFPEFDPTEEIHEPYLFWFFSRTYVEEALKSLSAKDKKLINLFRDWIEGSYGEEWSYIDSEFEKGVVCPMSVKYLVRPGDVLISRKAEKIDAYIATTWPQFFEPKSSRNQVIDLYFTETLANSLEPKLHKDRLQGRAKPSVSVHQSNKQDIKTSDALVQKVAKEDYLWTIEAWSWSFDGEFKKTTQVLRLKIAARTERVRIPITSLEIFPLKYDDTGLEARLKKRGEIFWKCRERYLVSCVDHFEDEISVKQDRDRYMVDVATYSQYRRKKNEKSQSEGLRNPQNGTKDMALTLSFHATKSGDMLESTLKLDKFPDTSELLVFPRSVVSYDLRRKLWIDLQVDHIREVVWNTQAFESLAIDDDAKELLEAVVTNQIASSKGTDIIADKGNGLIILLHGGPGTGKTFTAESMADFAKKPLYRVTCGDIGTNLEQVETYLESVLHLGHIWDCVVLLDEADVFLEERGQQDLARNALVSVFLRILEYYQGILVLTSNRVGTFDEAFKSRIQLTLHYDKLSLAQRRKIWRNFIQRLKNLGDNNVDFDDINDHIDNLVTREMNGRQIRNVITTARQLAQYRGKNLCFSHLEHVMKIADKFDTYIQNVKEGLTEDQLARDAGFR
ncbi:AAA family ATPase [Bipolaris maydis]|nr:AAA family ATPase [Bipolaris maydis]